MPDLLDPSAIIREVIQMAQELYRMEPGVLWIIYSLLLTIQTIHDKMEARRKDLDDRKLREDKTVTELKTADALKEMAAGYVTQANAYKSLADRQETVIEIVTRRNL